MQRVSALKWEAVRPHWPRTKHLMTCGSLLPTVHTHTSPQWRHVPILTLRQDQRMNNRSDKTYLMSGIRNQTYKCCKATAAQGNNKLLMSTTERSSHIFVFTTWFSCHSTGPNRRSPSARQEKPTPPATCCHAATRHSPGPRRRRGSRHSTMKSPRGSHRLHLPRPRPRSTPPVHRRDAQQCAHSTLHDKWHCLPLQCRDTPRGR